MKFTIFSLARCGSTSLATIINKCRVGHCINEPFSPDNANSQFYRIAILNGIAEALEQIDQLSIGLKHVWHPAGWPFPSPKFNDELMLNRNRILILLYRKNILRRVVSHEMARQSGVWHLDSPERMTKREEFTYYKLDPVRIEWYIKNERMILEKAGRRLDETGIQWRKCAYEDIFERSNDLEAMRASMCSIMGFIGLEHHSVQRAEMEIGKFLEEGAMQTSFSHYDRIPEIAGIEGRFGSADTGFLFKDAMENL